MAASGDWPVRNEEDRATLTSRADVLLAVSRGLVAAGFEVIDVHDAEMPGRIAFSLGGTPDWVAPLVGAPAPDSLTYRRGERWPVKSVETAEIRTLVEGGRQSVAIRGHQIDVTVEGDLVVVPAYGRTVTVLPGPTRSY